MQLSRNFEVIDHGMRFRIADAEDAVLESLEMDFRSRSTSSNSATEEAVLAMQWRRFTRPTPAG